MKNFSTIVALATPEGTSALAVLRISGILSERIATEAFGKARIIPRRAYFSMYKSVSGEILDECVWIFFKSPFTYTGEDLLEISCHGNPFIIRRIVSDLFLRGCIGAQPGEFTRRAFLNGKMDLIQAEAVSNIILAQSESSFNAARRLLSGELGEKIFQWNEKILELIAETETQIDFSEEEIPEINSEYFKLKIKKLIESLKEVADSARYFSKIKEGINVVIFGAPNAGKSSLFNSVLGSERALVSGEAGTTRDFISETVLIGTYCIRIIDTAGVRENFVSEIEKSGIKKTIDCLKTADIAVFVVDVSEVPPVLPQKILEIITEDKTLVVFNKNDLSPAFESADYFKGFESISLSALNGNSENIFKRRLIEFIEKKNIMPGKEVLVVSERHAGILRESAKILSDAMEEAGTVSIEFTSSKLRIAMEVLSEILGRTDNEQVLDKVFSSFCIGK